MKRFERYLVPVVRRWAREAGLHAPRVGHRPRTACSSHRAGVIVVGALDEWMRKSRRQVATPKAVLLLIDIISRRECRSTTMLSHHCCISTIVPGHSAL